MQSQQEERMSATLSLDEVIREPWDVVVAGAGPAGSLCAGILARRGISVLLVDKSDFPRDKVCGSCLNGAALTALSIAGLGDLPADLGAVRLHWMRMRAGGSEATIPLPHGLALSRRVFDSALVRAAIDAGAVFLPRTEAMLEPLSSMPRKIHLRAGGDSVRVSTRVAVAADGLAGGFLKSVGGLAPIVAARAPMGVGAVVEDESHCYPSGTIYMGCTPRGYVGAVRLEDGRVDVALVMDRGVAQSVGGTTFAAMEMLEKSGLPCPSGLAEASFRGTPYLTRRRQHVAREGLFVIGDAAGYVEPLTGEGMSWAMQQAILAVPLICDTVTSSDPRYAQEWQRQYERFFRHRRGVCLAASWLRRNFRFGNIVVGVLARMPGLAAPWVHAINQASPEILRSTAS